ncbi:hypothetical protein I7I50_04626 [Histoplasma capsulatum G186AR]|uniref:Uncharacterized protein n=1 Tax=Ajellomyces capsulatus TaxID=5037 RepID=A0A8H7YR39_AJECA|nr:hypothetical protein I7I52_05535 [Histoplasma capsulatum]QSS75480.1 hypothetical protein I7I50_04626 [Histoplasma capsulatum G186AR]
MEISLTIYPWAWWCGSAHSRQGHPTHHLYTATASRSIGTTEGENGKKFITAHRQAHWRPGSRMQQRVILVTLASIEKSLM